MRSENGEDIVDILRVNKIVFNPIAAPGPKGRQSGLMYFDHASGRIIGQENTEDPYPIEVSYEEKETTDTVYLSATPYLGETVNIKNSADGSIIIDGNGNNIDGASTYELTVGNATTIRFNGTEWSVISGSGGGSGESWTYVEQTTPSGTTTLPASPVVDVQYLIKNNTTTTVTVDGNGKNIENSATHSLIAGDSILIKYTGSKWLIIADGELLVPIEQWVVAPATSSSTGIKGQMAVDASYLYVCIATNTWVRAAIATSFP
jgi:hypothetical protein